MTDDTADDAADAAVRHRRQAIDANNSAWELLDGRDLTPDETDDLLQRAYAAAYHWRRAAGTTPAHAARAAWLISRCHATVGQADAALHHAERCRDIVAAAGLADFDLAYAHEALARAHACAGRLDEARAQQDRAAAVPIADHEDRKILDADIAAPPWFGLT